MIETYTGTRGVVRITTHDINGLPVAPDSNLNPTVKIIDPDTETVLLQSVASLMDVDYPGDYEFIIPSQYVQYDRTLKIEWSYSVDGSVIKETDFVYVVTPYSTVDEIVAELGFSMRPEDANYYSYDKIRSAARVARMMINTELGFSIGKTLKTVTAYGDGADVLLLPEKMLTINSLQENDELVIDNAIDYNIFGFDIEITETGYGIRVVPPNPGDDIDEQEEFDYTGFTMGRFRNGYRYEVTGISGWNYVPVEIKQCMYLLINDLLCNDSLWRTKYVKKINSGQMSVELSSQSFNGTGNALVDSILQKFKMIQAVII